MFSKCTRCTVMMELLFLMLMLLTTVTAKQCEYRDKCSCVFDDGSGMIDVTSIGYSDGFPVFFDYTAAVDPYMYSYNPCHPFSEGTCTNAAVCQYDYGNTLGYVTVGDADMVSFNYDGADVIIQYTSTDGTRNSYVTCKCVPASDFPFMAVIGESTMLNYFLNMEAKACCPVAAPPDWEPQGAGGLSGGSILLIIFFVALPVYLVGGAAYLRFRQQATGLDMVPNLAFWALLPGLIKEGAAFTMGLILKKRSVFTSNT